MQNPLFFLKKFKFKKKVNIFILLHISTVEPKWKPAEKLFPTDLFRENGSLLIS